MPASRSGAAIASSAMRGVDHRNSSTSANLLRPPGEDVAPRKNAVAQRDRFRRHDDLDIRRVEPAVHADGAAIVDVAGKLGARREQNQPAVSAGQRVGHRVGRGALVHVEQHGGLAGSPRFWPAAGQSRTHAPSPTKFSGRR